MIKEDIEYEELWEKFKEGRVEELRSTEIYLGEQGVAAAVRLTAGFGTGGQEDWYKGGSDAATHISLALNGNHQAKSLGPMVR